MNATVITGDSHIELAKMPDNSIDAIVTDPPYGLAFMGKKWDYDIPAVEIWAECLRVLRPGGHLLAFAGTRTQHRMCTRIEDAGFEIRDMIAWVYGCLDAATEVATERGVMPYHKTKIGDRVLCYDIENGEYTYQPILEIVEYDYSDTAYRLVGDFGEQVVSRNHRVIVERGGKEAFQLAETLECEARVPVLESLPALRQAIHDAHQGAGRPQQDVQPDLCECVDRRSERRDDSAGTTQGCDDQVRCLRGERVEAGCVAAQGGDADVQQGMQRRTARRGVGEACTHRAGALVSRVGGGVEGAHDGRVQPGLEGRTDVSQPEGSLRRSADQVRAMSCGPHEHGPQGWVFDGAQACGGAGNRPTADASGVCASHQPRCDGQPGGEPDTVRHERAAQGVRAWSGHRSAVVRVLPFHYTGKVWCLRVPTGAFVAVRNGVAFPTGNSGFPKSLDVSKAIDKAGGASPKDQASMLRAKREASGMRREHVAEAIGCTVSSVRDWEEGRARATGAPVEFIVPSDEYRSKLADLLGYSADERRLIGAAADRRGDGTVYGVGHSGELRAGGNTDAARQWQGWGTALKPALEPITVARKPLVGTVAENVLAHGTGALNIDGCRVGDTVETWPASRSYQRQDPGSESKGTQATGAPPPGRWPANLLHDGSDEVLAAFPQAPGQMAAISGTAPSEKTSNVYGRMRREGEDSADSDNEGSVGFKMKPGMRRLDSGSAARFFYCAKASKRDRDEGLDGFEAKPANSVYGDGLNTATKIRTEEQAEIGVSRELRRNNHPTVKPTDLMRYLCRLVTPPGGMVLDPFMGSGSTGKAALLEGFRFIGIERDEAYSAIARARLGISTDVDDLIG